MNGLFITVQGVIGTDPARSVWNGQPVLAFRMVNNERKFDGATRAWADVHSSWLWVNCYGELARNVDASLRKGDRVIVHGKMRVKDYVGAAGEARTGVDLVADALGPDLKFATARVRLPRREEDGEEQLRRHAEELQRGLEEVPRLSIAELIAQRSARPDDGPDDADDFDEELEELAEPADQAPAEDPAGGGSEGSAGIGGSAGAGGSDGGRAEGDAREEEVGGGDPTPATRSGWGGGPSGSRGSGSRAAVLAGAAP